MSNAASQNPLFDLSLPFGMPAFDRIRNEDFGPAFDAGMQSHRLEIKNIATDSAKPTFANTIEALERAGSGLDRVARIYFNLTSAHTNEELEALQRVIAPKLAAHSDSIMLDHQLFKRISTLYDIRDTLALDVESARLLERYYLDFVRSGANLNEADKERLKAINGELASLSTQFSQNVLKATNDGALVLDSEAQLAGLSPDEIKQAADSAAELGHQGKYVVALSNTTEQPLETVLSIRATRHRVRDPSRLGVRISSGA